MKRSAELQKRLHALEALGDAVSAMKSISAHAVQEARSAVEPARAYQQGVARIVQQSGVSWPAGRGPVGLLIIGAELGLCGGYNAQLVAAAVVHRSALGPGPTLCVGRRAASALARQGVTLDATYPGPAGVRAISELLLRVAEDLLSRYVGQGLSALEIVSSRFAGVGNAHPESLRLLPLKPSDGSATVALRYVQREHAALAIMREYLFITLFDLLLDALASEHAARLVATQAAERWLDERSAVLTRRLATSRRELSTQEVIEIAAGARAHGRR